MVLIETRTRMHDASNAPYEQRERERALNLAYIRLPKKPALKVAD